MGYKSPLLSGAPGTVDQLRILVAVAEQGSFNRAGTRPFYPG